MPQMFFIIAGGLISFLLFRASGEFGPAAVVNHLLVPLAPAYVGMRFGPTACLMAVLGATGLTLVVAGTGSALLYFLQFGVMAVALVWFLRHSRRWDHAVAYALAAVVAGTLLGLLGYAALQGQGPVAIANEIIGKEIAQTTEFMNRMFAESAATSDEADRLAAAVEQMAEFMSRVYPGMVVLVSGLLLMRMTGMLRVASQKRYRIPGPPFADWKAPEPLVWVLIAGGFLVVLTRGALQTIAMNLLVVLLPVYFLQGLAIIDHFFRRKAVSPVLRVLGFLLATLVNPLPMFVTGIGVFDLWFDFRKPREQKK